MTRSDIRTRIAPSPTGPCHLGTARTALFNYLFAKGHARHGRGTGTFIFRLEDTDRERSTPEFEQELYDSLHWLGLHWDEGPDVADGVGGPYGPYRQSERADRHRAAIDKLLETGHAYRCFCTPEELDAERKRQMANKELVHYSGRCRALSPDEIKANVDAGKPFTVRFRMPDETFTFTDIIRGEVTVEGSTMGDFVIAKPNAALPSEIGNPIFHLSNVVDDAEMAITHIIRGEDHLSNVPKHIALFRALGYEPPVYAHLPLILNPDGSKMSKRKTIEGLEPYVRVFREKGYLHEAVVSYLALLGWSPGDAKASPKPFHKERPGDAKASPKPFHKERPGDDTEALTLDQLTDVFALEKVSKAGARFDIKKLNDLNGQYIRALPEDRLMEELLPHFPGVPEDSLRKVVALVRERLVTIPEAAVYNSMFFERLLGISEYLYDDKKLEKYFARPEYLKYDPDYDASDLVLRKRHTARGSATMIREVVEWLKSLSDNDFTAERLEEAIRSIAESPPYNWKARHLFMVIRVAVTGKTASPPLFQTMEVIGKSRCTGRLRFALEKLAEMGATPWAEEQL